MEVTNDELVYHGISILTPWATRAMLGWQWVFIKELTSGIMLLLPTKNAPRASLTFEVNSPVIKGSLMPVIIYVTEKSAASIILEVN